MSPAAQDPEPHAELADQLTEESRIFTKESLERCIADQVEPELRTALADLRNERHVQVELTKNAHSFKVYDPDALKTSDWLCSIEGVGIPDDAVISGVTAGGIGVISRAATRSGRVTAHISPRPAVCRACNGTGAISVFIDDEGRSYGIGAKGPICPACPAGRARMAHYRMTVPVPEVAWAVDNGEEYDDFYVSGVAFDEDQAKRLAAHIGGGYEVLPVCGPETELRQMLKLSTRFTMEGAVRDHEAPRLLPEWPPGRELEAMVIGEYGISLWGSDHEAVEKLHAEAVLKYTADPATWFPLREPTLAEYLPGFPRVPGPGRIVDSARLA